MEKNKRDLLYFFNRYKQNIFSIVMMVSCCSNENSFKNYHFATCESWKYKMYFLQLYKVLEMPNIYRL